MAVESENNYSRTKGHLGLIVFEWFRVIIEADYICIRRGSCLILVNWGRPVLQCLTCPELSWLDFFAPKPSIQRHTHTFDHLATWSRYKWPTCFSRQNWKWKKTGVETVLVWLGCLVRENSEAVCQHSPQLPLWKDPIMICLLSTHPPDGYCTHTIMHCPNCIDPKGTKCDWVGYGRQVCPSTQMLVLMLMWWFARHFNDVDSLLPKQQNSFFCCLLVMYFTIMQQVIAWVLRKLNSNGLYNAEIGLLLGQQIVP